MEIFNSIILPLISSGFFVWLSKEWVGIRLKRGIKHEYDEQLVSLKAALSKEAAFHAAAHSSFSAGQKAAMERKLNSIDAIWRKTVDFRNSLPPVVTLIDVLLPGEYKNFKDKPIFKELTGTLTEQKIVALSPLNVEEHRPYIGEYIWSLFFSYQSILLRITLLLYWAQKDVGKIEWFKDDLIRQVLQAVLTPKELLSFDELEMSKIAWLKREIEGKILNAMHKIISGEDFVPKSIEQINTIQFALSKLNQETQSALKK